MIQLTAPIVCAEHPFEEPGQWKEMIWEEDECHPHNGGAFTRPGGWVCEACQREAFMESFGQDAEDAA